MTISVTPRGRLRIAETVTFAPFDKNPKHVYYRKVEDRQLPQKIWPGDTVTGQLKKSFGTTYRLSYHAVEPGDKPLQATLGYEVERVYYEGDPGYWVFDLGYEAIKSATIQLDSLPSGATAWLFDSSIAGKVIAKCEGTGAACRLATDLNIKTPRLILRGPRPADAYLPGVVKRFANARVKVDLRQDSTMRLEFNAADFEKSRSALDAWYMPILNERETFVAKTEGDYAGTFERYLVGAYLRAKAGSSRVTADIAFPAGNRSEVKGMVDIAIGSLDTSIQMGGITAAHEKAQYTDYKEIEIHLPSDTKIAAEVIYCKDNWAYSSYCETEERALSELQQQGNIARVRLLEPAVRKEMVLRIFTPSDFFKETAPLTLFGYQLRHYWRFGYKPDWLHMAFVVLYLILFVLGVILVAKVVGRIRENIRKAKEQEQLQATETAALKQIRARDPGFDLDAFRARGKAIATHIQDSWCAGDMRDCRRYLSQGVYNRFRLQLKIMRDLEKRKNIMADFEIRRFYLLRHNRSGDYDCLIVRMDAAARDIMTEIDRPDGEARRAAKKAPLNAFTEYYSFMRKREAVTEHADRYDACSHCGTPYKGEGELTKCKSCGAIAGSGTFDWVLAEITQSSEYRDSAARQNLTEASSDRIEDRASFVFWRDLMAGLTGNRDYVIRDATDTYLEKELKKQGLYDIAVGAADLESYRANSTEAIAKVRIKWSAAGLKATNVRHRQSVVTMRAQNTHIAGAGFAEHSCSACGAPLPETDSIECSYCHSPIQRKNADWLIDSVETTVE